MALSLIDAIGVFACSDHEENPEFKLADSAPKSNDNSFFRSDPFTNLKKTTLPNHYKDLSLECICRFPSNDDNNYHYLKKIKDKKGNFFVLSLISRRKDLENSELHYLFRNIQLIYQCSSSVDDQLSGMIKNPLGYTGKDVLVMASEKKIAEVKQTMNDNIQKALLQGVLLSDLDDKSDQLENITKIFEKNSRKLNSCC